MFGLHFFLLLSLFEWKDFLKYPSNMFFCSDKKQATYLFHSRETLEAGSLFEHKTSFQAFLTFKNI
jgi:hypothetical protein